MICGQGVAPQAATIAKFRELGLDLIPGTRLLADTTSPEPRTDRAGF
jgi:gamma-glutamyltranspeptidase / glutathione hydrolase